MDMIDFDKMTEEIEEVVNKYGLTIDFGKGTIGKETEITLKLRNSAKQKGDNMIIFDLNCKECKECKEFNFDEKTGNLTINCDNPNCEKMKQFLERNSDKTIRLD